jgi:hypothetical protein
MPAYTKRVQTVLSDSQYEMLNRLATERHTPVSVLIRDAVETVYFERVQREQRLTALERLLALDAPVDDWPVMEEQIIRGATECLPDAGSSGPA